LDIMMNKLKDLRFAIMLIDLNILRQAYLLALHS